MSSGHLTELTWMRYFSGEFGPLRRLRVRRHLAACEACRTVASAAAEERARFQAAPERGFERARLVGISRSHAGPQRLPWMLGGGVLAAALMALLVFRTSSPHSLTPKGGANLFSLSVQRAGAVSTLGEACNTGDRVMARFTSEARFLLILERDGRGNIQLLFPAEGGAVPLARRVSTTPTSFELDATPGDECFAAFFSDAPVDEHDASEALRLSPQHPTLRGSDVRVQCCQKRPAP